MNTQTYSYCNLEVVGVQVMLLIKRIKELNGLRDASDGNPWPPAVSVKDADGPVGWSKS